MSLLELAERVEALTGPDRDIDTEILWHVDRAAFSRGFWNAASGLPRPLEQMPSKVGLGWIGAQCSAPVYTGAIDAAKSLVPTKLFRNMRPGQWWWQVDQWDGESTAHVAYENHDSGIPEFAGKAVTASLSLCAASLRATHDLREDWA